jgi:hypothetical protein
MWHLLAFEQQNNGVIREAPAFRAVQGSIEQLQAERAITHHTPPAAAG